MVLSKSINLFESQPEAGQPLAEILNQFKSMIMEEIKHDKIKQSVLDYIKILFEEMEKEIAISHQEKYAILEDAFESAIDSSELRIAFEQWYADHAEDINFEHDMDELWGQAVGGQD